MEDQRKLFDGIPKATRREVLLPRVRLLVTELEPELGPEIQTVDEVYAEIFSKFLAPTVKPFVSFARQFSKTALVWSDFNDNTPALSYDKPAKKKHYYSLEDTTKQNGPPVNNLSRKNNRR